MKKTITNFVKLIFRPIVNFFAKIADRFIYRLESPRLLQQELANQILLSIENLLQSNNTEVNRLLEKNLSQYVINSTTFQQELANQILLSLENLLKSNNTEVNRLLENNLPQYLINSTTFQQEKEVQPVQSSSPELINTIENIILKQIQDQLSINTNDLYVKLLNIFSINDITNSDYCFLDPDAREELIKLLLNHHGDVLFIGNEVDLRLFTNRLPNITFSKLSSLNMLDNIKIQQLKYSCIVICDSRLTTIVGSNIQFGRYITTLTTHEIVMYVSMPYIGPSGVFGIKNRIHDVSILNMVRSVLHETGFFHVALPFSKEIENCFSQAIDGFGNYRTLPNDQDDVFHTNYWIYANRIPFLEDLDNSDAS